MDIGIATGKVAGRLVGPAMPGRVGLPLLLGLLAALQAS